MKLDSASEKISYIVKSHLGPALRKAGFKGSGRHFRRAHPHCTACVGVQTGMGCYAGEGYFFLENGLYYPELERRLGLEVTEKPTAFACSLDLRERVDPPDGGASWDIN